MKNTALILTALAIATLSGTAQVTVPAYVNNIGANGQYTNKPAFEVSFAGQTTQGRIVGACGVYPYGASSPTQYVTLSPGQAYSGSITLTEPGTFCNAANVSVVGAPSCWDLYVNGRFCNFSPNLYYCNWNGSSSYSFSLEYRLNGNTYPIAEWSASKADGQTASADQNFQHYQMRADGKSQARARILQGYSTNQVTFSFGGDSLGCTLVNGLLTAGTNSGTVKVTATVAGSDPCLIKDFYFDLDNCSSCAGGTCRKHGSVSTDLHSVDVKLGLGTSYVNGSAGYLQVKEALPSGALGTPATLRCAFLRPELQTITNAQGTLVQIKSLDGLILVATNTASSYALSFYGATNVNGNTNGLYTTTGSPFKVVTLENVSGDTNHFRVTDSVRGILADYYWQTSGWKMVTGGGLREETRQEATNGTQRTVTRQVKNGAGDIEHESSEVWDGTNLAMTIEGSGSGAQTNSYSYYPNGQTQQENLSDGSWAIYTYDGQNRRTAKYAPFLNSAPTTNSANCRLTTYDYSTNAVSGSGDTGIVSPFTPRCTIEYVLGQEVSRNYTALLSGQRKDIQCVNPGAAWNNSSNLVTTTYLFTDALRYNKPSKIVRPDGVTEQFDENTAILNTTYYFKTTRSVGSTNSSGTITRGTKEEVYKDTARMLPILRLVTDIASGLVIEQETNTYDADSHLINTVYLDGTSASWSYDCCHLQSFTDRKGIVTSYDYDALDRVTATVRDGITTVTEYNANGDVVKTKRVGNDSSEITTSETAYDTAGNILWQNNALGKTTSYTNWVDGSGQLVKMTTNPDSGTRIEAFALDGSLVQVTGTAVNQVRYEQGVESLNSVYRLYTKEIKLDSNGADTGEWQKSWTDGAGQTIKTLFADNAAQYLYYSAGHLVRQVDPDGVTTLLQYDPWGQVEYQAIDVNQNGVIDLSGTDRVTRTLRDTSTHGTSTVQRVQTLVLGTDNSSTQTLLQMTETAANSLYAWQTSAGATAQSYTTLLGNGAWRTTASAADGTATVRNYQGDKPTSLVISNSSGIITQQTLEYDAHNRLWKSTDARNGTTTYAYNDADQIVSVTTPAPGAGVSAQTTGTTYDDAGRVVVTRYPDNTASTNEYALTGALKKSYGSRTYPVEYSYDFDGRLKTLKTWKNYATDAGAAITTWNYNTNRGWLVGKTYADGTGPVYSYTSAGRPKSRVWARGITSTNSYNSAGSLTAVSYSDSTPGVSISYNRLGQPLSVQNGVTNTLAYSPYGQLVSEDIKSGGLNYFSQLRYGFDSVNRLQGLTNLTIGYAQAFEYNGNEMTSVSSDSRRADYTYAANSPLIDTVTVTQGNSTVTTASRQYDNLNRLTQISATAGFTAAYGYNAANQRTSMTNADGSLWSYGYDALGQVTQGQRSWPTGSRIAGQQFEYAFDDIGNRTETRTGGDGNGNNLRTALYNVNMVNQYTNREVPGFVEVNGITTNTATVMVNGNSPDSQGSYFRAEVPVDNTLGSVFTNITTTASDQTSTSTVVRAVFVSQTPESFQYDADGNLLQDGQWSYRWDAENRLVGMQTLTNAIPAERRLKLDFSYDFMGRRLCKAVSRLNTGNGQWQLVSRKKFFYDGWNLIGEQDEVTGTRITFTWGLDLSQTRQGAGGVGGLLWMTVYTGTNANSYAAAYDGNGNVLGLNNTADGSEAARYEYGPFGELLQATGTTAKVCPFRFSSKYQDDETGLLYYGFRYYKPSTGSWVSRDPIEESGGINTYGFLANNPLAQVDILGKANSGLLAIELAIHWAFGNGRDFRRNSGDWVDFMSAHPSVTQVLKDEYKTFAARKIAPQCKCRSDVITGSYTVKSDAPIIADNTLIKDVLNRGHVAQSGRYRADCSARAVTFIPGQTTYWDEVIWKIKGWVPDDWNTYWADAVIGYTTSYAGYVNATTTPAGWVGLAPTFQQFYFEVNWSGGTSIRTTFNSL